MLLYRLKQNKIITLIATTILLISILFTFFLFHKINKANLSRLTFNNELLKNEKIFSFYRNDVCLGKVLIKSNNNKDNLVIFTKGTLNIVTNKSPLSLNLDGFIQFNSLSQMVNLNAELKTSLNSLFLKITGLKEIIISLSSKNPPKSIFLHAIAGPLVLDTINDKLFGLSLNSIPITDFSNQLNNYKIPLESFSLKEADCQIDPKNHFDIDYLTNKLETIFKFNYE
jgi:hypothetical protein